MTVSSAIRDRFAAVVKELPSSATINEDSSTGKQYSIIFTYFNNAELYNQDGLDFANLLSKMNKIGLKIIVQQSNSIAEEFEGFTIISPAKKNFVITFKDEAGILNPEIVPIAEKKEKPQTDLSILTYHAAKLGNSIHISDIEKLIEILQDFHKKADSDSQKIIEFELKHYLNKLSSLIARETYLQAVKRFCLITHELKQNNEYTRTIDDQLQELKAIKETCIHALKAMNESSTQIPNEIQKFIDSYEKPLEKKDFNFIYSHAIASKDSVKINNAILKLENILRKPEKSPAKTGGGTSLEEEETAPLQNDDAEKIHVYIYLLEAQLEELQSSVGEMLGNLYIKDPK